MFGKKSIAAVLLMSTLVLGSVASPASVYADRTLNGNVTTLSSGATTNTGLNLYVDGSVAVGGDGSKDTPFKTLPQARDAIRAKKGVLPAGGITVWVKGGTYKITGTFELTSSDSGSNGKSIVYRSYPGEKVIISNGVSVDPTLWKPLNSEAQKRVNPKVSAAKLVELDVRSMGLTNINSYPGGTSFSDKWGIIDLIVNSELQPISQWPNPEEVAGGKRGGWTTANGSADAKSFYYGEDGVPADGDTINALNADGTNRADRWKNSIAQGHDLYLQGFWRTLWSPLMSKVQSINTSDGSITLLDMPAGGMGSKFSKDVAGSNPVYRVGEGTEEWRALNLLDEIDQPGEWALDFKDGKIYYYPKGNIADMDVEIADKPNAVVKMNGASYISFLGFQIEDTLGNGIDLQKSHHITIAGNTVMNVGNGGIIDTYGYSNMIKSNDIYDTGGFGISIGSAGDRKTLTGASTRITNNHIHHIGQHAHLAGIVIRDSVGVWVDHNLVHDVPRDAVRYERNNNLTFEYNEVHNTALAESDTGAFYTAQDWSSYGNDLRYNFIHHNQRANGFYADGSDAGDNYYNNIIQGSDRALQLNGHHNIAKNNVIVASNTARIENRSDTLAISAAVTQNYGVSSIFADTLRDKNPTSGVWLNYAAQLKAKYGYTDNLWSDILNPAWRPEYSNGSKIIDNALVQVGSVIKPKYGDYTVANNNTIDSISAASFYNYSQMDLRSKNSQVLSKFPNLNSIFPQIGLQQDAYRIRVVTRAETGGLTNRN
ncbi:hypothetical protein AR543_18415 [Paenibacillus bovis]|uniref:Right handed beta helix domain-containing protein n=2 Tax=Paenibacillus bovis TaxID=1616788 RepID=A0A172ZKX1_9BACL|nr:hypothetical protein AR543_18415 [Paenibacillus bovis]